MSANMIKRYKSKNHVTINNAIMKERDITLKAKGLFSMVMSLPDDWDFSINGICSIIKENYTAVNSAINELIEAGYCRRERIKENGKFVGCNYEFSEVKMGSPRLGFLNVENPHVENLNDNNNSSIDTPIIDKEINKESLSNDKQKKSRFVKPTIEQIAKYIEEKKMHFDAERFFDYYESTGWMVGRNHMKDWKAACRTWEHKRKQEDDKEEQKKADEIPADDIDPWKRFQDWCVRKITHIGRDKITYQDFAKMRAVVTFNSALMADILLAMDKSGFDGDIVKEFERMAESDEFSYRRF